MKVCFKCGEEKPLSEFYRHPTMADGDVNKCKDCARAYFCARRVSNADATREYEHNRGSLPHRIAKTAANTRVYRAKNPEKYKAHEIVNRAIRDGKLDRKPCEVCGSDKRVHAHHDDYSRPLDVRFFCPVHHAEHHKAMREEEAENAALA